MQGEQSWCTLQAWCAGAVLVPVSTRQLTQATGLPPSQLPGTELTVAVYLDSLLDSELEPRDWWPANRRTDLPKTA